MAEAEVGDDVFGEDPTINRLQEMVAGMLGKEAALYAPSGTQANQICLRTLGRPGDEIICDRYAHIYRNEAAASVVLSGLCFWPLDGDQGRFTAEQVVSAIQPDNIHLPETRIVALENTNNRGNGAVWDLEEVRRIGKVARENGLFMHLDGARIWHACLAGGYSFKELAAEFDTISVCLSKGLGAPVGSLMVSTMERVTRAIKVRKQYGGGMRQAGIIAAAAIHALENNLDRLAEDHARAKRLAEGLAEMKGVRLDPADCQSNIVIFDVSPSGMDSGTVMNKLAEEGVLVIPFSPTTLRAVPHLEIDDHDIDAALVAMNKVLGDVG